MFFECVYILQSKMWLQLLLMSLSGLAEIPKMLQLGLPALECSGGIWVLQFSLYNLPLLLVSEVVWLSTGTYLLLQDTGERQLREQAFFYRYMIFKRKILDNKSMFLTSFQQYYFFEREGRSTKWYVKDWCCWLGNNPEGSSCAGVCVTIS